MKFILSLGIFFLCLVCLCESMNQHRNKVCYTAMTCIHNGREKCGKDGRGNLRRFFDTCDLLEFNCLKGTDYTKTSRSRCNNLPPIDNNDENHAIVHSPNSSEERAIEGHIEMNTNEDLEGELKINDEIVISKVGKGKIKNDNKNTVINQNSDNEPVVDGNIIINTNEDLVEGEIKIDDEIAVSNQEIAPNDSEPAMQGKININTNEDLVEGEIKVEDEIPVSNEEIAPNNAEPVVKGSININTNEDLVEGEVKFNDEIPTSSKGIVHDDNEPLVDGQITMNTSEDLVQGEVKIDDRIDASNQEIIQNDNNYTAEGQMTMNTNEDLVEGEVKINDEIAVPKQGIIQKNNKTMVEGQMTINTNEDLVEGKIIVNEGKPAVEGKITANKHGDVKRKLLFDGAKPTKRRKVPLVKKRLRKLL